MPKPYPAEFRTRAVVLVRAGKPAAAVAGDLGISGSPPQRRAGQDAL
jgi:transposase